MLVIQMVSYMLDHTGLVSSIYLLFLMKYDLNKAYLTFRNV